MRANCFVSLSHQFMRALSSIARAAEWHTVQVQRVLDRIGPFVAAA
jgi:hypothetical protein